MIPSIACVDNSRTIINISKHIFDENGCSFRNIKFEVLEDCDRRIISFGFGHSCLFVEMALTVDVVAGTPVHEAIIARATTVNLRQ